MRFFHLLLILLLFTGCQFDKKSQVQTGLDRAAEFQSVFAGKRLGIIANHTAYNSQGVFITDVFRRMPGVKVSALFGPEHGFRGSHSAGVKVEEHNAFLDSIPIYSLYGKTLKPTPQMLKNVDLLVFDIQDIGARFYTYIWTMALAMEAAAEQHIPFVVLDRPNPINGVQVEGGVLDTAFASFVGLYPIPVRHGMTVGELARLFNGEGWLKNGVKADLTVIPMKGWKRAEWFDQTGLKFIPPSPNMPNLQTATVYPGMCLIEGTNVSEGRGTDRPFLQFGAPWINPSDLLAYLGRFHLPGVRFSPVDFTPKSLPGKALHPKYENETCHGLTLHVTDRRAFQPFLTGVRIVQSIHELYPRQLQWRAKHFDRLVGSDNLRKAISQNQDLTTLIKTWQEQVKAFQKLREKYELY
jgi:uncharacterized protein YbbC (DUF1343 family)